MYVALTHTHSSMRYLVLGLLLLVVVRSAIRWMGKNEFTPTDRKFSLVLLIVTHIQFVLGLVLYFVSPFVQFGAAAMKEPTTRYWTVEHITGMLLAVILITIAYSTVKRMKDAVPRHRRLFIFNAAALALILVMIQLSGRGFFSVPGQ